MFIKSTLIELGCWVALPGFESAEPGEDYLMVPVPGRGLAVRQG